MLYKKKMSLQILHESRKLETYQVIGNCFHGVYLKKNREKLLTNIIHQLHYL